MASKNSAADLHVVLTAVAVVRAGKEECAVNVIFGGSALGHRVEGN
jgi:hypothetical protein